MILSESFNLLCFHRNNNIYPSQRLNEVKHIKIFCELIAFHCFSNGRTPHLCTALICRFKKNVLSWFSPPLGPCSALSVPRLLPFPPLYFLLFCLQICPQLTHSEIRPSSSNPSSPSSFGPSFLLSMVAKPFKAGFSRLPAASHHPLLSYPAQSGSGSQYITVVCPLRASVTACR